MQSAPAHNSRRDAFKSMFQKSEFLGFASMDMDGLKASEMALRPPAAIAEKAFVEACTRCGDCVSACPHNSLILATVDDVLAIGTPYFIPSINPCQMCPDVPCVNHCPTNALDASLLQTDSVTVIDMVVDFKASPMGMARIDEASCLAFFNVHCDACYRACPLQDQAISMEILSEDLQEQPQILKPKIHSTLCTGCGICEHACVKDAPAIYVIPKELTTKNMGSHHIEEWRRSDSKRAAAQVKKRQSVFVLGDDYLNDLQGLMED